MAAYPCHSACTGDDALMFESHLPVLYIGLELTRSSSLSDKLGCSPPLETVQTLEK